MCLREIGLVLATIAARNLFMPIRRILLLCFLTITLALTGPFSRGMPSKAAGFPQTADIIQSGSMVNLKTGAAPSRRCLRGAITWSNCSFDTGYTPSVPRQILAGMANRFDTLHGAAADNLRASRIFRPPRSS